MPTNPKSILAIDPGTKELGIALLQEEELCYFGVKTIKQRRPVARLLNEIADWLIKLMQAYQPQVLAIEKTFLLQRNAALLNVVAAEIKRLANEHGLIVHEYDPALVRRAICQLSKATKRETARHIALWYPELTHYLQQISKWGELYWAHVFDAVAVAVMCQRDLFPNGDSTPVHSPELI